MAIVKISDPGTNHYRFDDIEMGKFFDLCILRTANQMQPYEYNIDAQGKLTLKQIGQQEGNQDFFGTVQFDERNHESSIFTPTVGTAFPHYCEFTLDEGGKIDGCSKLAVSGKKKINGSLKYVFPIWKISQNVVFRENAEFKVGGIGGELSEYKIYKSRAGGIETIEGEIKGLNMVTNFSDFYLIPHVLPEKLVVFYATNNENEILNWHNKLNDNANHPGDTLMVGINTPLFRDDEMSIFVTFDANLDWYTSKPA